MNSLSQNNGLSGRKTPSRKVALQALKESAIAPGDYTPSTSFLIAKSIAIVMDGTPIVLLGFEGDKDSNDAADRLLASQQFHALVEYEFGEYNELTKAVVANEGYSGHQEYNSIVKSEQGKIEDEAEKGRLEALLPVGSQAFGFAMCVSNELSKCFIPEAVDIFQDITLD